MRIGTLHLAILALGLTSVQRSVGEGASHRNATGPRKLGMQVLSPHLLAITFSSANFYFLKEDDGFTMRRLNAEIYRLPLPDFASSAGLTQAILFAGDQGDTVTIDGHAPTSTTCAETGIHVKLSRPYCASSPAVTVQTHEREIVLSFPSGVKLPPLMSLIVKTNLPMKQVVGWATDDPSETTSLPAIKPLMDYTMRDVYIAPGEHGEYLLTGSTGAPDIWAVTSDIQVWKSKDLQTWAPIATEPRARSVVWSIDRDGTWEKPITLRDGAPFRPLWAPEIHFIKGTYWIPYSVPRRGTGLLKSISGKPEGPYRSAMRMDAPLTTGIDASLFEDENGSVYFLWAGGKIARMTDQMDGLAEPEHQLRPANAPLVGFEGSSIFKYRGKYYLSAADYTNGDYNCFTASSDSLYGPYSDRYISVPHGGHNNFFQDESGQIWSTFFGSDAHAPVHEKPAIVPIRLDSRGELKPFLPR